MARCFRLLILQLLLIFLIANVSSYVLPDFSQANEDIVLFLTPYGIIKNLANRSSSLRPFYFEISTGQQQLTSLKVGLLMFLFAIMILNLIWIMKGLKRR